MQGRPVAVLACGEIDEVIHPAETRAWLQRVLAAACAAPLPPRRPFIDTW